MLARLSLGFLLGLSGLACSGGVSGDSTGSSGSFYVAGSNITEAQVWRINRAIEVRFSEDVDFGTVSLNTIRVADGTGFSATGTFYQPEDPETGLVDRTRVVFQPNCPLEDDFSDAGLLPGKNYFLTIASSLNAPTLVSTSGARISSGIVVSFSTPDSSDPLELFQDSVPGPPQVVILPERPEAGILLDPDTPASHVEIGGVKRFFGIDPDTQSGMLEPGLSLPLCHYSLPENQVAFVLQFDQSILATSENLGRLRVEYLTASGWSRVPSQAGLEANCTVDGSRVRLVPTGILPQKRQLRTVIEAGFVDLSGDGTGATVANATLVQTLGAGDQNPIFPDISNPAADEILEGFGLDSLEDKAAVFPVPTAIWGDGRLEANFAFGGTGGPDGEFDWHVPPATEIVLDTTSDVIFGGPGGAQTGSQPVTNGLVDIRDLYLPASSMIRIVGPNTCTILASGNVRVEGEIYLSGSDNPGVATLNTANQPEPGAVGQGGGGDGGTGSYLTTQSTPRGGAGEGAFNVPGAGGQGGEASYDQAQGPYRRGSGGGGGTLGPDVLYDHDNLESTELVRCQELIGLDAEYGNSGAAYEALGAESQSYRAQGGLVAPLPFVDSDDGNDFLGTRKTTEGTLILGELPGIWAGSGGGGGGDSVAADEFPHPNFNPWSDEKGAGGGGGAGGLQILAIGSIVIGTESLAGRISADGGTGGGGENGGTRIGGGSGGGGGGHVVLSSAAEIVIYGRVEGGGPWYKDPQPVQGHKARPITAAGGQGGAGNFNRGGASFGQKVPWNCDRIPFDYFPYEDIRPFEEVCFYNLPDYEDPEGPCVAAGGDGGPGIVQLHVDDLADLHFPTLEAEFGGSYATGLDVSYVMSPPPVGWKRPGEEPDQMIPFFGRLSMTRSRWIPLGLAREKENFGTSQVLLKGLGGAIEHGPGETVQSEDPLVGPEIITNPGIQLSLDASTLAPEDARYRDNPALLRRATVLFQDTGSADYSANFVIAQASYDGDADRFELWMDPTGPDPSGFFPEGDIEASLVPRTVRLETSGIMDAYPENNAVILEYDATVVDPVTGLPSEANTFSASNGDLLAEDLDDLNSSNWDFFRFQIIFDLDIGGVGVHPTSPRPGMDHLRVQFEF